MTRKILNGAILALLLAFSGLAAETPPKKKKKLAWIQDMATLANPPSKRPVTVAGVRGLEEVGAAPDLTTRDVAAIDRLDKIQIKDDELKTFVGEGKLR